MKNVIKFLLLSTVLTIVYTACDKVDKLPFYENGTPVVLSSTSNSIAPAPADSNNVAVTFSWTSPNYATDTSNYKFVIEIDSADRGFSKKVTKVVLGSLSTSFTAKELNTILLGFGFDYNTAYNVDVRIISSYANNNEQYESNVLRMSMTPYVIPPKITPPASGKLFLVGNATQGGWNNPVPVPTQEFNKIDSVTYGGVFQLNGGGEYLVLPVNGDWSHKYSVTDKSLPGLSAGGDFGYDLADNFPGPASSGMYKIILDFQHGTFTLTPFTQVLPTALFLVGDATPGGWNNPVPVPSQEFTRDNSCKYSLTINLTGGKEYLMLPVNGDWSHKFSVSDKTLPGLSAGGAFGYDLSDNFPGPSTSGTYTISADFLNYKFKVTP